jgi:hypothetical protein
MRFAPRPKITLDKLRKREKITGRKRGAKAASAEESLEKIAAALERIADSMKKRYKEPG